MSRYFEGKIPWEKTEVLIFDLGGVLLNLDFSKTEAAFTQAGIPDFKRYFALGHASDVFSDYEKGVVSDEEFLTKAAQLTQGKLSETAVETAWNAMLLDFPAHRVALLKELSSRVPIYLYSNTNAIHYRYFLSRFRESYQLELDELFVKAYYSHQIGHRKPDAAGFNFIVQDAGLNPSTTTFIDDAKINVEGAAAAGWNGVWLPPDWDVTHLFKDAKN